MLDMIRSPWGETFRSLVGRASSSLILCAPFVGFGPCETIRHRAHSWCSGFRLLILTDLSRDNMLSGATDVVAIASVADAFPQTEIRFLPSLHAKVYVADTTEAIVTSANMTDSGLQRNLEYGVRFTEASLVRRIQADILDYANLASPILKERLGVLAAITQDLRKTRDEAQRSLKRSLRREFERKLGEAEEEVIRARAAGRTCAAVFADAIRHILRHGPASTEQIHAGIRAIHPDFCDDTVDRIIDGEHYGKKWKHQVRSAQQYLKKYGEIQLVNRIWRLCH